MTHESSSTVFTSLQMHYLKRQRTGVWLTVQTPDGVDTAGALLSAQQVAELKCTADAQCGRDATHFVNLVGKEFLCCDEHAQECRRGTVGVNQNLWFCRPFIAQKDEAQCFYTPVMRTPPNAKESVGMLPWLWYPIQESVQFSDNGVYLISRNAIEELELPENVSWQPITHKEIEALLAQITQEWWGSGRRSTIFGFAPEHPFDRPDFSLAFSIEQHVCDECVSEHAEPYPLEYGVAAETINHEEIIGTSQVIELNPRTGRIQAAAPPH